MKTTAVQIHDAAGNTIAGSKALVWGNNAACICIKCGQLHANRGDDPRLSCSCGEKYEIRTLPDRDGGKLGKATGVVRL